MAEKTITAVSWNVNGLRSVHKKGFLQPLLERRPDMICLQETKVAEQEVPPELQDLDGYRTYFSSGQRKGYSGVALFSRQEPLDISRSIGSPEFDVEGRVLAADFGLFLLLNVYFPNGGASPERLRYKLDFYGAFLAYLEGLRRQGRNVVICGDVNTAHREIDLARPRENSRVSGFLPEERAWIDRLLSRGYIDTFRMFDDRPGQYTWWDSKTRARERNVGWRIDYFLVSESLRGCVRSSYILPEMAGSDHCPIGLELAVPEEFCASSMPVRQGCRGLQSPGVTIT